MLTLIGEPTRDNVIDSRYQVLFNTHTDSVILHFARNVILKKLFYIKHLGPNYNYQDKSFEEFVEEVCEHFEGENGKVKNPFYNDCIAYIKNLSDEEINALYYWVLSTNRMQSKIDLILSDEYGYEEERKDYLRIKGNYIAYRLNNPKESELDIELGITLEMLCGIDYKHDEKTFSNNPLKTLQEHYYAFMEGIDMQYLDEELNDEMNEQVAKDFEDFDFDSYSVKNQEGYELDNVPENDNSDDDIMDYFFYFDDYEYLVNKEVLQWVKD